MEEFEGGEEARGQQVLSAEVQNRVVEAFEVFDHENNKTVDVREVCPSIKHIEIFINFLLSDWNHHKIPRPLPQ